MLAGTHGGAARMAMSILVRMAEVYGATTLMDISAAHIDSTIYIGEAGLEYAERLAGLGARVVVPTTSNVSGLDEQHWRDWPVPEDWAEKSHRQMVAYQSMGIAPTWTCAPYQTDTKPVFGQQIAWGESNAIVFANSVIGARTERYPDLLDICCALTGRVPAFGLHLSENRGGDILFQLAGDVGADLEQDDSFYPVLGHLIGKIAQDRIPVVEGIQVQPTEDQLKAFGAAAASAGTVALFHLVGITPEAPTVAAALRGRKPAEMVPVTMDLLRRARRELTSTGEPTQSDGDRQRLDMVALGSPHFSLPEFKMLARLLHGQRRHENVRFLVTTSRAVALLARQAGYLQTLEEFGGQVTVDTCILATPMLPPSVRQLMTNSGKYAYYAPGMLGTRVAFGSLEDCVRSAVEGQIIVDDRLWGASNDSAPVLVAPRVSDQRRAFGALMSDGEARKAVIPGPAEGELLVSGEPLSFWGGYDYHTGEIIDRRHPLSGRIAAGRVLAVPLTRGSSTTTAVLLEAVRAGTAPAAIITTGIDSFFALGSIVADEMYGKPVPVYAYSEDEFSQLKSGDRIRIGE